MTRKITRTCGWTAALLAVALLAVPTAQAEKRLLRLRVNGPVLEAPSDEMDLAVLFGGQKSRTLRQWVAAIDKAAEDSEIDGIVMVLEDPAIGLSQVEEFTRAIKRFQKTGKKVHCFIDYAGNAKYALAASADYITIAEYSYLDVLGLRAELSFFKGLLEKIGVQADLMHCGDYKSALEPFTRTEPSKEAAEQVNWLLDGIYDGLVQLIADGRGLSPSEVKTAIDQAPLDAQQALKLRLVDAVGSFADFKSMIHKEYGKDVEIVKKYPKDDEFKLDFNNPFAMFELFNKLFEKTSEEKKAGIGLVYIDGMITAGTNSNGMFGRTAGSTTIRAAFEKARADDSIKAIVVRVDSPGGSALASDIMWDAAVRCAKEKPLVVSMGNVAGSGGYYVSLPGDVIFAEGTTITGSIGVVGGKFVVSGLFEDKLGITSTEFTRGKNAALMSGNRPWNDEERERMRKLLYQVYDQFKGRVTESRGDRIKGDLEQLAGGRVYTGRQALERGLVDRIGGLSDAMAYAAERVGLEDYEVYVLPKQKGIGEIFMALMGEEGEDEWEIASGQPLTSDPFTRAVLPLLQRFAPQQFERIAAGLHQAMIINREHIGMFTPFDVDFR